MTLPPKKQCGNQVGECLPRAGAGFGDDTCATFHRGKNGARHLKLLRSWSIERKNVFKRPDIGEDFVQIHTASLSEGLLNRGSVDAALVISVAGRIFLDVAGGARGIGVAGILTAYGEYRNGDPGSRPCCYFMVFLQMHEFPTIHSLTEGLAGAGYSVLAPTLSLGLSHRKQSMACEAIHSHKMQDGSQEIAAWIAWLKARKADPSSWSVIASAVWKRWLF